MIFSTFKGWPGFCIKTEKGFLLNQFHSLFHFDPVIDEMDFSWELKQGEFKQFIFTDPLRIDHLLSEV